MYEDKAFTLFPACMREKEAACEKSGDLIILRHARTYLCFTIRGVHSRCENLFELQCLSLGATNTQRVDYKYELHGCIVRRKGSLDEARPGLFVKGGLFCETHFLTCVWSPLVSHAVVPLSPGILSGHCSLWKCNQPKN